ncbi:6,7-dimethyl-8-ribityllumazine synthase [Natrinema halophilum]|uniref:6,7-dimethyl-8-ribityllumazine synthase n=1 Tax=Natrinema halophilum TaxID=1699371 RepID=A0A7D5H920_9EURY|nr:6,7-dimethyl-8-ribityllumazine synthase [Natrinema halophilum]QLG49955.1 6,7-dimethyl-8-ribityllumazine synthase [Natrinema halophilum]
MNVVFVHATVNGEFVDEMLSIARQRAEEQNVSVVDTIDVAGVHELPVVVEAALERDNVDGVAVFGAVVKGSTDHDQLLANNVSKQLLEQSCNHVKPVGYGIIGPDASWKEVSKRLEHYAKGAVDAVTDADAALTQAQPSD